MSNRPDKSRALEILRAQAKAKRENALRGFVPYPKQIEFVAATKDHSECALTAGNQTGKSSIGAVMAAVFATGLYPEWWTGRRFDGPVRGWCCGESASLVRDVAQRKLCGPPGDEENFGTGTIPKSLLVGKIPGHGAGGALDKVRVKHVSGGISEITFKSYDQDRAKWQGETLDFVWCDEEPPLGHYVEAMARCIATDGLLFSTFTPLSGMLNVIPRFREGVRDRCLIRMAMSDCRHLDDPGTREKLLAAFPRHEHRARLEGLPALGSGSVFEGVELSTLIEPLSLFNGQVLHNGKPLNTSWWAFLWGIDFGINHPFGAVLTAWDRDNDCFLVLAEVKLKDQVVAVHSSRIRSIAGHVPVAWPHDGTQREKGSGESVASIYKKEGLLMLPKHATHEDGSISTEGGIAEMLARMQSGRFKVAEGCREWAEEFGNYHRKDGMIVKQGDDLLSATRIACMARRFARPAALGPVRPGQDGTYRRRYRGPEIAEGTDFNVFGV